VLVYIESKLWLVIVNYVAQDVVSVDNIYIYIYIIHLLVLIKGIILLGE